ncbi:LuxR C-terminal-related transcriptional regulator [Porticoccus sp. W117]|uniref:LuxR C-terminal-related transcriptional regulator n=1 Tax=Porticoccus sp. W117 TaxID=3054777 RepID=UPI00259AC146|nr:LuxR C-terminal-related transcriptional regulator [Porticoccus sp. W117]MDM3870809.1 LuxR C-terminal-related transcriptional regulator [Porticoccus sp. W117]
MEKTHDGLLQATNEEDVADLVLVSDVASLQNSLLLEKFEEQLSIHCKLVESGQLECGTCILLDCAVLTAEQAGQAIKDSQEWLPSPTIALLNATAFSSHEGLMQWPRVNGIFYNSTGHAKLLEGVATILKGEYWLPRRLLHSFVENSRRIPNTQTCSANLTRREWQILQHIVDGKTNAAIAGELFVSEHTIKSHLYNIFKKVGVKNRVEASNWARENL